MSDMILVANQATIREFSLAPGTCGVWFTITFREKRIECRERIGEGFGRSDSNSDTEFWLNGTLKLI
jgi:hypothetical protein